MNQRYLILKRKVPKAQGGFLSSLGRQYPMENQPVGSELAKIGAEKAYGSFKTPAEREATNRAHYGATTYDELFQNGGRVPIAQDGFASNIINTRKKDIVPNAPSYGVNSIIGIDDRGMSTSEGAAASANAIAPSASKISSGILAGAAPIDFGGDGEKNPNTAALVGMGAQAAGIGANYLIDRASKKNSRTSGFGTEIYDEKDAKLETGKGAISGAVKGFQMASATGNPFIMAGGALAGLAAGAWGGKKKGEESLAAYEDLLGKQIATKGRQEDLALTRALTGKSGMKLGKFLLPKKKSNALVMRAGGKLEEPGEVNVVVKGKLHKENNNLGNKDKGIPVINESGIKEYEVEEGEVIFRQEVTLKIEELAKAYEENKDDTLLEELGNYMIEELLNNTQDNYGKFDVEVKEELEEVTV